MPKTDEQLRKDFEVSLLFHPELHHGAKHPFVKDADGTYTVRHIERMFEGYRLAMNSKDARLDRYNPERFIGNGHINELHEALEKDGHALVSVGQIRTILKVIGGWPV